MLSKKQLKLSMVCNFIIAAVTIGVVISYYFGNDGEYHIPPSFRFFLFTTDSNLLCMITSLILGIFEVRALSKGKPIPDLILILKYVGTISVCLTFAVVMLFLGPIMGYMEMLSGTSIYMHFAGPILAFVSFCLIEAACHLKKRLILIAAIPTLLYGVLYAVEVVVIGADNGGWIDFYHFNTNGMWYLTFTALILLTVGLAAIVRIVHNKTVKKNTLSQ